MSVALRQFSSSVKASRSCHTWTSHRWKRCAPSKSYNTAPAGRRNHWAPNLSPDVVCHASSVTSEYNEASDVLDCDVGSPDSRYQPSLSIKEKKVHKAKAEGLAKQNKLVKFQLGAQGFSASFLTGCIDALLKHEVIRVKLGGFTKEELAQATELLEQTLDCLVVYQIGHTLTLYRQAGLPRPSNLPPLATAVPEQFEYEDETAKRSKHGGTTDEEKQTKKQQRKAKAARDSAAAAKLPPEFKVL